MRPCLPGGSAISAVREHCCECCSRFVSYGSSTTHVHALTLLRRSASTAIPCHTLGVVVVIAKRSWGCGRGTLLRIDELSLHFVFCRWASPLLCLRLSSRLLVAGGLYLQRHSAAGCLICITLPGSGSRRARLVSEVELPYLAACLNLPLPLSLTLSLSLTLYISSFSLHVYI